MQLNKRFEGVPALGDFTLVRVMGEPGSEVLQARSRDGRDVVLRFWRSDSELDARAAVELLTNARDVRHPMLASVFGVREHPDHSLSIVSEYVPGRTLDSWIADVGLPPLTMAVDYVRRLALGLHAAHQRGLSHHALYPGNIVVLESETKPKGRIVAKLLDLGVPRLMRPLLRFEAAHFMAPEALSSALQSGGRPIAANDAMNVYSCGCLLHYLCTGQPPFQSDSLERLSALHAAGASAAPSRIKREIPENLERVITHALEREPMRRVASAAALAASLSYVESVWRSSGIRRKSVTPPPPPASNAQRTAPVRSFPPPPPVAPRASRVPLLRPVEESCPVAEANRSRLSLPAVQAQRSVATPMPMPPKRRTELVRLAPRLVTDVSGMQAAPKQPEFAQQSELRDHAELSGRLEPTKRTERATPQEPTNEHGSVEQLDPAKQSRLAKQPGLTISLERASAAAARGEAKKPIEVAARAEATMPVEAAARVEAMMPVEAAARAEATKPVEVAERSGVASQPELPTRRELAKSPERAQCSSAEPLAALHAGFEAASDSEADVSASTPAAVALQLIAADRRAVSTEAPRVEPAKLARQRALQWPFAGPVAPAETPASASESAPRLPSADDADESATIAAHEAASGASSANVSAVVLKGVDAPGRPAGPSRVPSMFGLRGVGRATAKHADAGRERSDPDRATRVTSPAQRNPGAAQSVLRASASSETVIPAQVAAPRRPARQVTQKYPSLRARVAQARAREAESTAAIAAALMNAGLGSREQGIGGVFEQPASPTAAAIALSQVPAAVDPAVPELVSAVHDVSALQRATFDSPASELASEELDASAVPGTTAPQPYVTNLLSSDLAVSSLQRVATESAASESVRSELALSAGHGATAEASAPDLASADLDTAKETPSGVAVSNEAAQALHAPARETSCAIIDAEHAGACAAAVDATESLPVWAEPVTQVLALDSVETSVLETAGATHEASPVSCDAANVAVPETPRAERDLSSVQPDAVAASVVSIGTRVTPTDPYSDTPAQAAAGDSVHSDPVSTPTTADSSQPLASFDVAIATGDTAARWFRSTETSWPRVLVTPAPIGADVDPTPPPAPVFGSRAEPIATNRFDPPSREAIGAIDHTPAPAAEPSDARSRPHSVPPPLPRASRARRPLDCDDVADSPLAIAERNSLSPYEVLPRNSAVSSHEDAVQQVLAARGRATRHWPWAAAVGAGIGAYVSLLALVGAPAPPHAVSHPEPAHTVDAVRVEGQIFPIASDWQPAAKASLAVATTDSSVSSPSDDALASAQLEPKTPSDTANSERAKLRHTDRLLDGIQLSREKRIAAPRPAADPVIASLPSPEIPRLTQPSHVAQAPQVVVIGEVWATPSVVNAAELRPADRTPSVGVSPTAAGPRSRQSEARAENLEVRGSMTDASVRRAIERVRPQFTGCFAEHAPASAAASVARVEITIDENGRARDARVHGSPSEALDQCLQQASRKIVAGAPDTGLVKATWNVRYGR